MTFLSVEMVFYNAHNKNNQDQYLKAFDLYISGDTLQWAGLHGFHHDTFPTCPKARRSPDTRAATPTGKRIHQPVLFLHQEASHVHEQFRIPLAEKKEYYVDF